jgi:hypothetical protein
MANLLEQLDALNDELANVSEIIDKTETFRTFGSWIQEHHAGANIVCEINKFRDMVSIDANGTITKADSLLQIRYNDARKAKKGTEIKKKNS